MFRLEGELGEDWRILGDISSLPRRAQQSLKPKNEEAFQENKLEASQRENEARFVDLQVAQQSPECNELRLTTRESPTTSSTKNSNFLPPSSSIAFLERLLKDRRNEGKARTVTFGE